MLVGERFVLVENPKTASTSMQNALPGETVRSKHDNLASQNNGYPWRRYRIWTVRNPWDRMVSGYHHNTRSARKTNKEYPQFEEWVMGDPWITGPGTDFKRTSQLFWGFRCNTVLRFEDIAEAEEKVSGIVGEQITFPMLNVSDRDHYREYYTPKLIDVIADRFAADIKTYGYEFG